MVTIRLSRIGKKGERKFRVVVKEKRSRRDGKAIEYLGWYEKREDKEKLILNKERYTYWTKNGAIPSETVYKLVNA